MKIGVFHFPTDYGIDISELAQALEARGLESLFVCEHTRIPVSGRTPFYADAGITRVLLDAPDSGRDEVLSLLDQYATFVAKTA